MELERNPRRRNVKTTRILAMMAAVILVMVWSHIILAEEKSIALPAGTKVEKLGQGHFKFKLPSGRMVEVKGYSKGSGTTAMIGNSRIYDRTGKLIASAKQGMLKSGPKPKELIKDSRNYVKIDEDITWLPATITFQAVEIKRKQGPKGLSPQPDPPGKK